VVVDGARLCGRPGLPKLMALELFKPFIMSHDFRRAEVRTSRRRSTSRSMVPGSGTCSEVITTAPGSAEPGARLITSSSTSQTSGTIDSTCFFAALMFLDGLPLGQSRLDEDGLKARGGAISFGRRTGGFRLGPGRSPRAARVVDAPSRFWRNRPACPLEHVGQRLQRSICRAGDRAAVVEQLRLRPPRHPATRLLTMIRCAKVRQPLEGRFDFRLMTRRYRSLGHRREPARRQDYHQAELRAESPAASSTGSGLFSDVMRRSRPSAADRAAVKHWPFEVLDHLAQRPLLPRWSRSRADRGSTPPIPAPEFADRCGEPSDRETRGASCSSFTTAGSSSRKASASLRADAHRRRRLPGRRCGGP